MLAAEMKTLLLLFIAALVQGATTPGPPAAREIAPDTFLLPGAVPADRGPDGNTVVLVAPSGLTAIDTRRHSWHSDAILALARSRNQPVAAIVNTHWHLYPRAGTGE